MRGCRIRSRGIANYFAAYPQFEKHNYYSVQLGNIYLITLDSSTFLSHGGHSIVGSMHS